MEMKVHRRKKSVLAFGVLFFCALAMVPGNSSAVPTLFQKVRTETFSKLGQVPKPNKAIKIGAIPITLANAFWVDEKGDSTGHVHPDRPGQRREHSSDGRLEVIVNHRKIYL